MTSVIKSETIEGESCSKIEYLLLLVQVSKLYINVSLVPGGLESHIYMFAELLPHCFYDLGHTFSFSAFLLRCIVVVGLILYFDFFITSARRGTSDV